MYIGAIPTPAATESRQEFTATANQTVFNTTGGTVGYCDCYLNGVKMANSDFSFDGADVTLTTGAAAGDVLAVVMRQADNALVALPITDSAGNNVLSESGSVVTLTADAAVLEGSSSGDLVRITQTGTGNALVVEDSANPDSTPFVVNSIGRVGVGTSSPPWDLSVYKDSAANVGFTLQNSTTGNTTNDGLLMYVDASGNAEFRNRENTYLAFWTNDTQRMVIDSSGDVLLRTTSSTIDSANNGTSLGVVFKHSRAASGGASVAQFFGQAGECRILGDGDVVNTNESYGVISDIKLKENIVDAAPKLSDICNIRIVNYNLKKNPKRKLLGVIAQEVETIFPGIVSEIIDEDSEGNDLGTTTKYVKTSVFIPMLIKAIQEQQTLIESQQSQIDALTARIEALETTA